VNDIPVVTIIIPCLNEINFIDTCLTSVLNFELNSGSFEVIVVDGMSTDGTRNALAWWTMRYPKYMRVLDNPYQIVPTAMNIGIREARGRWIVRLDAHSMYPSDYLSLCLDTAMSSNADNVGGVVIPQRKDETRQASLIQALTTHSFGVGDAEFRLETTSAYVDTVPFGCYRRDVFEKIGLFDERLVRNQDYEFNRRLTSAGGRIWLNPDIRIYYYNEPTLGELFQQARYTGRWNPYMWVVAPYSFSPRHAIPGLFLLGLLKGILAIHLLPVLVLPYGMILLLYGILALISAAQQSYKYGKWMLPILPFLFLLYHLNYGYGILRGVIDVLLHRSPVQNGQEVWKGAGFKLIKPKELKNGFVYSAQQITVDP